MVRFELIAEGKRFSYFIMVGPNAKWMTLEIVLFGTASFDRSFPVSDSGLSFKNFFLFLTAG